MIWLALYAVLGICWGVFCNKMQKTLYPQTKSLKKERLYLFIGFAVNSILFPLSILFGFYNNAIVKIMDIEEAEMLEFYNSDCKGDSVLLYPEGTIRTVRCLSFKGFYYETQESFIETYGEDGENSRNVWGNIER